MRRMLTTLPRSTLHSAVCLPSSEIVHWPPPAVRSVYLPSTAFAVLKFSLSGQGLFSHVGLRSARFSKLYFEHVLIYQWNKALQTDMQIWIVFTTCSTYTIKSIIIHIQTFNNLLTTSNRTESRLLILPGKISGIMIK